VSGRLPFQGDSALAMAAVRLDRDAPPVRSVRPELDPRWDAALATCLARDPAQRFARADQVPGALTGTTARPAARRGAGWWRLAAGGAAAVALTGAAVAALLSAGGRETAPVREASPVATTAPLVAVVPLRNLSTRPESAWLGTAVAEILSTELGAGERLRVVPSDQVGTAARARGVALDGADDDAAGALGVALAADYVLSGSVVAVGDPAGSRVRVELRLRDGASGKVVTQLGADGREAELFAIVSRLGADVRARLGRGRLSASEQAAATGARPQSMEAARAFAEGVTALGRYEAQRARALFERAIELEPDRARYHAGLASAWRALQFPERTRQAAERAFALSDGLPQPERMFNEARHHQSARRFDRAIEIYSALATFFPENIEYRIALGEVESEAGRPRAVLATVDRLRADPTGASDPRIDLLEAGAARTVGDNERATRAALAARDRARSLGATAMESIAELRVCEVLTSKDFELALAACRKAAADSEALGDRATVARALMQTAFIRERQDARAEAEQLLARALQLYQEIGNVRGVGLALDRMGKTLKSQGKLEEAMALQQQALARVHDAGDDLTAASILEGMAATEVERGRLDSARRLYGEAIELDRKVGNEKGHAIALQNLAWIEHDAGDVVAARRHAEEAMAMQERRGEELDLAYSLDCAAIMALEQDDLATADRLLARALALREKLKMKAVATLQNMAEVRLVQGRLDDARALITRSLAGATGGLDEGYAREVELRILLQAGDLDGAARALARSRELTGDRSRVILDMDEARLLVARGQARRAIALLHGAAARARKSGAITQRIAADAALGEAELAAGLPTGAERLLRAEREAAAHGFSLMARQAAEARMRPVATSTHP
jgi:tetratricopeptide (TPR) repeat protein